MQMNLPRHEFSKENKPYLLQFLKEAKYTSSSKYCNYAEYLVMKDMLPLDDNLKHDLENYIASENPIVDITQSDEEENVDINKPEVQLISKLEHDFEPTFKNVNQPTINDVTCAIKENLDSLKSLSYSVINNLETANLNLEDIFSALSEELNFEEVLNLGSSLNSAVITKSSIISCYFRYLLVKKLNNEFSDQLQCVLNGFSQKYPEILKDEMTNFFVDSVNVVSKVFLQFLDGLGVDFKTKIFRNFIFSCISLQEKHIGLVDILLNDHAENDSLNKLVDIMSTAANRYSSDKAFGKLMVKIIQLLGKNVSLLEQPLKYIIGTHMSIWKLKMQKTYEEYYQDTSLISQSFR